MNPTILMGRLALATAITPRRDVLRTLISQAGYGQRKGNTIRQMHHWRTRRAWPLILAIAVAACTLGRPPVDGAGPGSASPSAQEFPVVLAAGDIGACDSDGDEATAALLEEHDGAILALGDLAYPAGRADDFTKCYAPSWGPDRDRTHPVPGNHEYATLRAKPYYDYFGAAAGDPQEGWYAFDLAEWHVIALNSNCWEIGGCSADSRQAEWLRADLADHSSACTLAFWHHPRWSSGEVHGSDGATTTFWEVLHDAGGDIVLAGHDHLYERFEPMDRDGVAEPDGMVEFVVGTGGKSLFGFADILPTSAAHDNSSFGVLKLTLRPGAYDWEFLSTSGTGFTDAGTTACR